MSARQGPHAHPCGERRRGRRSAELPAQGDASPPAFPSSQSSCRRMRGCVTDPRERGLCCSPPSISASALPASG
jgi:hypothetical protein